MKPLRTGLAFPSAVGLLAMLAANCCADFCRVEDGHLYRNGARLRLWGVNINPSGPDSVSYETIDAGIARLKQMGFNAVRIWGNPGTAEIRDERLTPVAYEKGDGSPADLADYLVTRLGEEGVNIWLTWLHARQPGPATGDVGIIGDPATAEAWQAAVRELEGKGNKWLEYFDPRCKALRKEYLRLLATRVNRHTGKTYAEDDNIVLLQLNNEHCFMDNALGGKWGDGKRDFMEGMPEFFRRQIHQQWADFLRAKYGDQDGLLQAWGQLDEGESLADATIKLQPTYGRTGDYPPARGADLVEFLHHAFADTCGEWQAYAHQIGLQAPITFDCLQSPGTHLSYSVSGGDFISAGSYPWMHAQDARTPLPHYPWPSFAEKPPGSFSMDYHRHLGKPFVVYETNVFKPAKYRADYPLRMALLASWNDWDGVFFYVWDYGLKYKPEDYLGERLFYATPDHMPHGLTLYSDEIFLSQLKVAGRAFLSGGLPIAQPPTVFRYGRNDLFNADNRWGGTINSVVGPTTLTFGARLAFDPQQEATSVEGEVAEGYPDDGLRPTEGLHYDWPRERLIVDQPAVEAMAGFLETDAKLGDLELSRVTKLLPDDADVIPPTDDEPARYLPFYVLTIASADGKPLDSAERILLSIVSTAENSGFTFDPSRITGGLGAVLIQGTVSRGSAPVQVNRMGCRLKAPWLAGKVARRRNFAMEVYEEAPIEGDALDIRPTEPLFFAEIAVR